MASGTIILLWGAADLFEMIQLVQKFIFFPSTFLTFHFHFYCLINRDFILIVFIFKWSLAAVFSICFDSLLQN